MLVTTFQSLTIPAVLRKYSVRRHTATFHTHLCWSTSEHETEFRRPQHPRHRMKLIGERSAERDWVYAVAGALLVGGPVWHYLFASHYPFSRPEAWVLPLLAAAVGAAAAFTAHRIGGWVETLCYAVLVYICVDLQFDLHVIIPALGLAVGCVAVSRLLRARRALVTTITLGAFYLAALPAHFAGSPVTTARAAITGAKDLPVLVHLVLDEQWGPGGLRAEGDSATASFLDDFYTRRGFEVYDAAYSRFGETLGALPLVMSLGQPPALRMITRGIHYQLTSIPYFERLRALGYTIRVYQSSFIDYCHAGVPVESCLEASGNSIANVGYLEGPWTRRAVIAMRYFLNVRSHVYVSFHPDGDAWQRSSVGGGLRAAEVLTSDIARGPATGVAYFAHLLLPHRPFEVDANCVAYGNLNERVGFDSHSYLTGAQWRSLLALYDAQSRCTHRKVAEVLDALDAVAGPGKSIVLIHGDHGARIGQEDFSPRPGLSKRSLRRLNAFYSTLLALRRPTVPAAIHSEPVPMQDFVWQLARQSFQGPVTSDWEQFIRVYRKDSLGADTLRVMTRKEMLWAP